MRPRRLSDEALTAGMKLDTLALMLFLALTRVWKKE
jgi:hypothetical protein